MRWKERGQGSARFAAHCPAPVLRRLAGKLSPEVASALVDRLWSTPRLDVVLAARLRGHPDREVQQEVEALLRRRLGESGTWFPGEATVDELLEFHTGVIRDGLAAVEKALGASPARQRKAALILLARYGIYLD